MLVLPTAKTLTQGKILTRTSPYYPRVRGAPQRAAACLRVVAYLSRTMRARARIVRGLRVA